MIAKKRLVWVVVCGLALALPDRARAGSDLKLDDVIAKHIEAIGGLKAWKAVKTMRMTGKVVAGGNFEIPIVMEAKRPRMIRSDFTIQGMTGTRAFDGEVAWALMPMWGRTEAEKLPEDERKMLEDQADFEGPLIDYQKKGYKVELLTKEEIEGTEAYKLKVVRDEDAVEYHYLDADHFLTIKLSGKRKVHGTEVEFEANLSDYKKVDGLVLPHVIRQTGMGEAVITFDKIEMNVELNDSRFKMPDPKPEAAPEKKAEGQAPKPPTAEEKPKSDKE